MDTSTKQLEKASKNYTLAQNRSKSMQNAIALVRVFHLGIPRMSLVLWFSSH